MPEIVIPDLSHAVCLEKLRKALCYVMRLDQIVNLVDTYIQKVENGIVYTVEGNSGDSCRQNQYPVGHYEILGYGVPAY